MFVTRGRWAPRTWVAILSISSDWRALPKPRRARRAPHATVAATRRAHVRERQRRSRQRRPVPVATPARLRREFAVSPALRRRCIVTPPTRNHLHRRRGRSPRSIVRLHRRAGRRRHVIPVAGTCVSRRRWGRLPVFGARRTATAQTIRRRVLAKATTATSHWTAAAPTAGATASTKAATEAVSITAVAAATSSVSIAVVAAAAATVVPVVCPSVHCTRWHAIN